MMGESLIWFFLTLLLMGLFSGIEMAFYSANRLGLELRKKEQQSEPSSGPMPIGYY